MTNPPKTEPTDVSLVTTFEAKEMLVNAEYYYSENSIVPNYQALQACKKLLSEGYVTFNNKTFKIKDPEWNDDLGLIELEDE